MFNFLKFTDNKQNNLLFRYKPLDLGLEKRITKNKVLSKELNIIDLSEPWGDPLKASKWTKYAKPNTIGLVWGMFKLDSPVFIEFCRKHNIPLMFVERSPLLKNGKLALYFDERGTTNFSRYWGKENWSELKKVSFSDHQRQMLKKYRNEVSSMSMGVDIQKTGFQNKDEIKETLGIPQDKKIIFCPMQVDDDVTITQKHSSPWINSMSQFLSVIEESLDSVPDNYHLIVKEHPRNVISKKLTAFREKKKNISFVRESINANALCQGCDAILTINSGMGTEALVFQKTIISLGKSFYSEKGINFEAKNISELRGLLSRIENLHPPKELIDRYIYHFIYDFTYDLTMKEDSLRFLQWIEKEIPFSTK